MTSTALIPRVSVAPLPPNGPVSSLTGRIVELLRVEEGDVVVDLSCHDLQSPRAMPQAIRLRAQPIVPCPFSERLAFLLSTSGVRMVQMGALTFERLPMRYEQVLLRDGFSEFKGSLHRLLTTVLRQLDPAGRVLIVDSAPSPDAPLFTEGLERWNRQRRSPESIARAMREAGFSAHVETLECLRRVPTAECYAWVESRGWPGLESFREADLQRGLCELRARYGSQRAVEFMSRFDLVLGTKPDPLAT